VLLLDVRTREEFASGHIAGALLIPVQELERRMDELEDSRTKTIIAYCRTGNRSGRAAAMLSAKGFTVFNMKGGIVEWDAERLPLIEEPSQ
jgi:rhodanese-related sulfurtransferase